MKLKPIIIVFVAPTKKRNPFLSCWIISEPIVAACPEPMPGRNAQKGEEIKIAPIDLKKSFFFIFISFNGTIFCFWIWDLVFREITNAESPKSPERRGIKGSFTGRLNAKYPKSPAREKVTNEMNGSSSLRIK